MEILLKFYNALSLNNYNGEKLAKTKTRPKAC